MTTLLIVKLGSTYPWLAEELGDFDDWIVDGMRDIPVRIDVISPHLGEHLPPVNGLGGIVLTGSHSMVTDREIWSETTAAWIPEALDREIPLLGICYGHQLLAHATGGPVGYNERGAEYGTTEIRLHDAAGGDPIFRNLPSPLRVHACHSQSVLTLPKKALVLASNDHDPHHAFRIGRNAWGVQFHPEFSLRATTAYLEQGSEALRSQGKDPEALLRSAGETPEAGSLLARFANYARDRSEGR